MVLRAIAAGALLCSAAAASGGAGAGAVAWAQPAREGRRLGAPTLTAAQIVEKNLAARGGLEAWRKVEAMAWAGHVEGGSPAPMPFHLELKRPNLTRFEIAAIDKRFVRVFDGTRGWRVRPGAAGVPEATAFSKEEAAFARDEFVIDGPLMDYEAKGVKVAVAGLDELAGRKAHLLEVTLPSGASRRVWIDAETFLEARSDRPSTNPLLRGAPVSVYYRDYRAIEGVVIPFTLELRAEAGAGGSQKLVIENVALNPKLEQSAFSKPATARQRNATIRIGDDASARRGP